MIAEKFVPIISIKYIIQIATHGWKISNHFLLWENIYFYLHYLYLFERITWHSWMNVRESSKHESFEERCIDLATSRLRRYALCIAAQVQRMGLCASRTFYYADNKSCTRLSGERRDVEGRWPLNSDGAYDIIDAQAPSRNLFLTLSRNRRRASKRWILRLSALPPINTLTSLFR